MRGMRSLTRKPSTQKESDARFLKRVLDYDLSVMERKLVTKLVSQYHRDIYQEISYILHNDFKLPREFVLDNLEFLMGKVKGQLEYRALHAECISKAYDIDPSLLCHWRTSPVEMRRKAIVSVRLAAVVELDVDNRLADEFITAHVHASPRFVEMGLKHWKRLDDLIDLALDGRGFNLGTIDVMLSDDLATPLTEGAL